MALRLPRPRRFDMWIALGGLIGGLALWGVGLAMRPAGEPTVLWPGHWPILPPLVVTAACELLRSTAPRTALPRPRRGGPVGRPRRPRPHPAQRPRHRGGRRGCGRRAGVGAGA